MKKLKKPILIGITIIIVFVVLVIAFVSPITKYLVEKYDVKILGREITSDWMYVNPFTGYVHIGNLKIYEEKSDSIFVSAQSVSANFTTSKLFSKTIDISEITLYHPRGMILYNDKTLNFQDIIDRFSRGKSKKKVKKKSSFHFNIFKIKIVDGEFHYRENITPVNYFVKHVNIESNGKRYDVDTMEATVSLVSGIGKGDLSGHISTNFNTLDYRFNALVHQFDAKIITQYVKALINYGSFKASVGGDIKVTGNFKSKENVVLKGLITINDCHLSKNSVEDYSSFEKFTLFINEISPSKHVYLIDSASIIHPYFKFELYDNHWDNIQEMFGREGANIKAANANSGNYNWLIEFAKYIKVLSKNFFKSNYKINRLAIYNGHFRYSDYTLSEKFSVDVGPINAIADSINKNGQWAKAIFKTGINPSGSAFVAVKINPKDSSDFDVNYTIKNIPLTLSNPYLIKYTSFPVDRGTVELNGSWTVRNNIINSNNHLLVIDPRINNKMRNHNNSWIPMRFLMFFARKQANVIDYEIPITGNLKDPKFHLKDVIFDALTNVFVKPATAVYRTNVKTTEKEIEKSISLSWEMNGSDLGKEQIRFINKTADFLKDNPTATITIHPIIFEEKEKEYIALYEARKKYYMLNVKNNHEFTEEDSIAINKLSIKDALFVKYLNQQTKDSMLFTVQDKCIRLIGSNTINAKFTQLNNEREKQFRSAFSENGIDKQLNFSSQENTIPYNGFSFYKLDYTGVFPEELLKAYERMSEFNSEEPREEYKKERVRKE